MVTYFLERLNKRCRSCHAQKSICYKNTESTLLQKAFVYSCILSVSPCSVFIAKKKTTKDVIQIMAKSGSVKIVCRRRTLLENGFVCLRNSCSNNLIFAVKNHSLQLLLLFPGTLVDQLSNFPRRTSPLTDHT